MATFYYITATAPATLLVSGKRFQLSSGDSRGPFSEAEKNAIMNGPDRRRLVATPFEKREGVEPPEVKPTVVDGFGLITGTAPSEIPPSEVPTAGAEFSDISVPDLSELESLVVLPSDVNEPLTSIEQELVQSSIGEVLPESPESDFAPSPTSSSMEMSSGEEEPQEVAPVVVDGEDLNSRASRRRRR